MERDKALERLESLKVGTTGAIAVSLTGLLLQLLQSAPILGLLPFLHLSILGFSGFLFGVTYRYIVQPNPNPHLKSGAVLSFAIVRGLATIEADLLPFAWPDLLAKIGPLVESFLIFGIAALALEKVMSCQNAPTATLRGVHHVAFNVKDMAAAKQFYGQVLELQELTGDDIPVTLKELVAAGKVANFVTPDGTVIDLFWEPELSPPAPNPEQQFTRCNHLAFDIAPEAFETAYNRLREQGVTIAEGPITRPTGRGVYVYDPDGFMIEIRCDPA